MSEITITIQLDGAIMVSRGTSQQNDFCLQILQNVVEDQELESLRDFFAFTDKSELIFGPGELCG